ncbi:MAG: hypothetical protein M1839_007607 [Geoglossum umbratile]|nr:MAG: hypothetical protein M1839_007607 [Geoglossum umbratile]
MIPDDVMSKVLTKLSKFYGIQIRSKKIKESYGILIADLWEEAYAQGLLENYGTSDGDRQEAFRQTTRKSRGPSIAEIAEKKNISQSDQPPKRNNGSQGEIAIHWTTEQQERVSGVVPDGEVDFDDVARQFEDRFGFRRTAYAIRQFSRSKLGRRADTDTWTIHQRRWIVRAAKNGTLWSHMVQPFNDKFKMSRTSDELKSQYKETLRYLDPTIAGEDKPQWTKHSEFKKFGVGKLERQSRMLCLLRFTRSI